MKGILILAGDLNVVQHPGVYTFEGITFLVTVTSITFPSERD